MNGSWWQGDSTLIVSSSAATTSSCRLSWNTAFKILKFPSIAAKLSTGESEAWTTWSTLQQQPGGNIQSHLNLPSKLVFIWITTKYDNVVVILERMLKKLCGKEASTVELNKMFTICGSCFVSLHNGTRRNSLRKDLLCMMWVRKDRAHLTQ